MTIALAAKKTVSRRCLVGGWQGGMFTHITLIYFDDEHVELQQMLCLYQNCGSKGFLLARSRNTLRPQCTHQLLRDSLATDQAEFVEGQSNMKSCSY